VICEKPLGMNVPEVKTMISACNDNDVSFMVAHCYRYAGSVNAIKELIDNGTLGRVEHINTNYSFFANQSARKWIFNPSIAGGGAIFDIGVHMVDLTRYLLSGKKLTGFKGFTKPSPEGGVDASATVIMEFDSEIQCKVSCSFELPYFTSIEIIGTKARLAASYFTILDRDANISIYTTNDFENPQQTITVNNGNFYAAEIEDFVANIGCKPPRSERYPTGRDGLVNQIILNHWSEGLNEEAIDDLVK
ncbi:MAG: Gfo/Idh/MocA family protein, partial [Promethearchaeota archaeon]